MTTTEIVDQIVAHPSRASRLLSRYEGRAGLSHTYFSQVYRYFVEDHSKLAVLRRATGFVVRYGDDASLGYRSLGIVERISGRWLASAEAFQRAGELAQSPEEQLSFQIGAIDGLARSGRISEALKLGHRIAGGLNALGAKGLASRARLNLGYALMEQDRFKEAAAELLGLPNELLAAGFSSDATSSRLALSTALLFGGNPGEARREAVAAAREASDDGSHLLANIALGNIAYTDLLRGEADVAVSSLLRLRQEHLDEPVELARVLEYLGDAYVTMNLFTEAIDVYGEATELGVSVSSIHRAHLRYGLGEALLAVNRPSEAIAHFKSAQRTYRQLKNAPWTAATELNLAFAQIKLDLPQAKTKLRRAVELARNTAYPLHLSKAFIVSAEMGGPASDLEEASRLARRRGLHRLVWRVEAERARRASGRIRLRHYRRMLEEILADQARTSSVSSRVRFLVDKQSALTRYIDELLEKPTSRRIQEAISVVTRSRSVTLLDEVILGRQANLSEAVLQQLSQLREELNQGDSKRSGEGNRRTAAVARNLDHLQRLWVEHTYPDSGLSASSPVSLPGQDDSQLYLTSGANIRVLSTDGITQLPIGEAELMRKLNWLHYDILAPMADKNACPAAAMEALKQLGEALIRPILDRPGVLGICPEGGLWWVPWIACLDAIGEVRDLELRLHPALRGNERLTEIDSAMVWIADHADLPRAKEEASAFLAIYPTAQVCESAQEVRSALHNSKVSLLHVISHARYSESHPMFSSLDFSDGPVLAAEIARSGLQVDLVTLSGCDTARLSGVNKLEPDGLVRSFLACGAGFVVGSAWPLDDEAAMNFYTSFFSSLESTANIYESLRSAREAVRSWKSHPFYWAFPLLYAGYRS